jgi:hypothetical protein
VLILTKLKIKIPTVINCIKYNSIEDFINEYFLAIFNIIITYCNNFKQENTNLKTGIDLEVKEEPFLCISTYDNDYFGSGKKVLNSIYYYRFFTDEEPNYAETHYDELELATEFNLYYVNFPILEKFLKKCINDGSIDPNIGREMIHVYNVYNEIYGG